MARKYAIQPLQRGFTLIEIMVVIAILAVLATLVLPNVLGQKDKADITKAKQDIRALEGALDLYRLDNYNYPTTDQGLQALVEPPSTEPAAPNWNEGGYVKKLPKDPWGREYLYLSPGENGDVDIYTYGRDGASGGEGADADIGNYNIQ